MSKKHADDNPFGLVQVTPEISINPRNVVGAKIVWETLAGRRELAGVTIYTTKETKVKGDERLAKMLQLDIGDET